MSLSGTDDGRTHTSAEDAADAFVQEILVPKQYESDLLRSRSVPQVRAFAARLGLPPGIVIGRLQCEGIIPHNVGNEQRTRFQLIDP